MRVCERCGDPIPEYAPSGCRTRRDARFCSENCRKRRWDREVYRKACVGCGADIRANRTPTRCRACWQKREAAEHEALLGVIEAMWNDGMPLKEMALALGRSSGPQSVNPELNELRLAGRIGYRYKAYEQRTAA